jgi:hypothetical protein
MIEKDQRIGSRVWDESGAELGDRDPRFRAAVVGKLGRDAESHSVTDGRFGCDRRSMG